MEHHSKAQRLVKGTKEHQEVLTTYGVKQEPKMN